MFFLSRIDPLVVIIIITVYSGLHFFIWLSFVKFFNIKKRSQKLISASIILFLALSFLLAYSLPHGFNDALAELLSYIFPIWIGIFTILILFLAILWIVKWIDIKLKLSVSLKSVALITFLTPALIIAYGIWFGSNVEINEVNIPVKNLLPYWKDKTIIQLSDLHLRSENQINFVNKITDIIKDISPELVLITGDFIARGNNNIKGLLFPFKKISAPILFVTGNHDRYSSIIQTFKDLGIDYITILDSRLYEKEGLQIIGLSYPRHGEPNPADVLRNEIPFDASKPTILLYHTPSTIDAEIMGDRYVSMNTDFSIVKNAGIDIQLSGHTHGGQFFPFSLLTHYLNNGCDKGLHRDGSFSLFVSTGLGTWGPPLRIFIPPEITVIHLYERTNSSKISGN